MRLFPIENQLFQYLCAMKKYYFLALLSILVIPSCVKEEVTVPDPFDDFYTRTRNVIVGETFEFGSYSQSLDPDNYGPGPGLCYVQNGPCPPISPGYLNIGCAEPILPKDSTYQRTYELGDVDTLRHFKSRYNIKLTDSNLVRYCFQIDYKEGGLTEIIVGNYLILNNFLPAELNNASLHVYFNVNQPKIIAFLNETNVSNRFWFQSSPFEAYAIDFKAKNVVEYIGGSPYINMNGLRIDQLQVYTVN
jgi:hypothetical protein